MRCDLCVIMRHERQRELLQTCGIPTSNENEIRSGYWDVVVEGRYPLSNAGRAFTHADQAGALKILIDPKNP